MSNYFGYGAVLTMYQNMVVIRWENEQNFMHNAEY